MQALPALLPMMVPVPLAANYSGPVLLMVVVLAPVALVATAVTWVLLPRRIKTSGDFGVRARRWLYLAAVYDFLLVMLFFKCVGVE